VAARSTTECEQPDSLGEPESCAGTSNEGIRKQDARGERSQSI